MLILPLTLTLTPTVTLPLTVTPPRTPTLTLTLTLTLPKVAFSELAPTAHTRRELTRVATAVVRAACGMLNADAEGLLQAAAMKSALAGSKTIQEQVRRGTTCLLHLASHRIASSLSLFLSL
jgi:histone H3/H4